MSARQTQMLEREAIANRPKHWVRLVTACNSKCLFCLDTDTPRNVYLPVDEVKQEILRGREELGAWKIILSGGEAALHPQYVELIRYAKEVGYGRIQTVTNGWRYADKQFFEECMDAGLQELTFSLHGHTKELHEMMTAHPGSFDRIVKGIIRAKRHPSRPIVSIDVCINKQNVPYLDKIVELGISLGVTEYDLLHVIPQAAAFENREMLFYDPMEHLDVLHKVFRLNQHPRFVIWTNRFPVAFLEGLEDLIQDPHKMLDEVNGRRFQVRNYIDTGKPLDCRTEERCTHCFVEPFCTTLDRVIEWQNDGEWDVWWPDGNEPKQALPFGCRWLGTTQPETTPKTAPLFVRTEEPFALTTLPEQSIAVAKSVAQLEAWLTPGVPAGVGVIVALNQETAPWLLANRSLLSEQLDRVRLHQPSYEHMRQAHEQDVRQPKRFFRFLDLPITVSGLPPCLVPGVKWTSPIRELRASLFEEGRLDIRETARFHIREGYFSKSLRCRDCVVTDRCDGAHINMLRDQGLKLLSPLVDGPWAEQAKEQLSEQFPKREKRLADGRLHEPAAPSLPGYAQPVQGVEDPLAVIARNVAKRRAERRKEIRRKIAESRHS